MSKRKGFLIALLMLLYASQAFAGEPGTEHQLKAGPTEDRFNVQLHRMTEALKNFIRADLPFHREERLARVEKLENLPAETGITPTERLRRVLKAYQQEMEYGRTVEAYEGELTSSKRRLVNYLRYGRVSLVYQTFDGSETAYWDRESQGWKPLNSRFAAEVRRGIRIAQKRVPPDLMILPVKAKAEAVHAKDDKPEKQPRRNTEPLEVSDLGDISALLRQFAGEASRQIDDSLISGELPGRAKALEELIQNRGTFGLDQVKKLWQSLLQEMRAQSEIKTFSAELILGDGNRSRHEITRIGPFTAIRGGRYVEYVPGRGEFRVLGHQPAGRFLDAAEELEQRNGEEIVAAAIDPSRGSILSLLVQTPDLKQRLHQGGLVGYIIIGIAAFGILLALVRIVMLRLVAHKVEQQKRQIDDLSNDNPLGRVLLSVAERDTSDGEMIERKLDESILKEIPALEWGLPLIKLLAAIAPLLGLLGTVVGMILTFQAISLFGTGDPRLMAGGISQALVTTVLGLITAIPLLLLHSIAVSAGRRVEQTLEEQAAALVAERIEKGCR